LERTNVARMCLESRTLALDAARRIDIVVTGRGWVLGIENKPAAVDQPLQVSDYLKDLRSRGSSTIRLMYLTRDGRHPPVHSIGKLECAEAIMRGELHPISYEHVIGWLVKCEAACVAPRVRWYLESFANYLRRSVIGKLPQREENMIYTTLLDAADPARLSTVLHLLQAKDAIRAELKRRVMNDIRDGLPKGWQILHALDDDGLLEVSLAGKPGWSFGIESEESTSTRRWWYGISFERGVSDKKRHHVQRAASAMTRKIAQSGEPNYYWAFWRWFEGIDEHEPREYDDWEANVRPWVDMVSGEMAAHFLALISRVGGLMEREMAALSK